MPKELAAATKTQDSGSKQTEPENESWTSSILTFFGSLVFNLPFAVLAVISYCGPAEAQNNDDSTSTDLIKRDASGLAKIGSPGVNVPVDKPSARASSEVNAGYGSKVAKLDLDLPPVSSRGLADGQLTNPLPGETDGSTLMLPCGRQTGGFDVIFSRTTPTSPTDHIMGIGLLPTTPPTIDKPTHEICNNCTNGDVGCDNFGYHVVYNSLTSNSIQVKSYNADGSLRQTLTLPNIPADASGFHTTPTPDGKNITLTYETTGMNKDVYAITYRKETDTFTLPERINDYTTDKQYNLRLLIDQKGRQVFYWVSDTCASGAKCLEIKVIDKGNTIIPEFSLLWNPPGGQAAYNIQSTKNYYYITYPSCTENKVALYDYNFQLKSTSPCFAGCVWTWGATIIPSIDDSTFKAFYSCWMNALGEEEFFVGNMTQSSHIVAASDGAVMQTNGAVQDGLENTAQLYTPRISGIWKPYLSLRLTTSEIYPYTPKDTIDLTQNQQTAVTALMLQSASTLYDDFEYQFVDFVNFFLALDSAPGTAVNIVKQSQINAGHVIARHTGGISTICGFGFRVRGLNGGVPGPWSPNIIVGNVHLTLVNFPPDVINSFINYPLAGQSLQITTDMISLSDPYGRTREIMLTIKFDPNAGSAVFVVCDNKGTVLGTYPFSAILDRNICVTYNGNGLPIVNITATNPQGGVVTFSVLGALTTIATTLPSNSTGTAPTPRATTNPGTDPATGLTWWETTITSFAVTAALGSILWLARLKAKRTMETRYIKLAREADAKANEDNQKYNALIVSPIVTQLSATMPSLTGLFRYVGLTRATNIENAVGSIVATLGMTPEIFNGMEITGQKEFISAVVTAIRTKFKNRTCRQKCLFFRATTQPQDIENARLEIASDVNAALAEGKRLRSSMADPGDLRPAIQFAENIAVRLEDLGDKNAAKRPDQDARHYAEGIEAGALAIWEQSKPKRAGSQGDDGSNSDQGEKDGTAFSPV